MNYSDYKVSRDLSWQIILQEKISSLPVQVSGLCRQMGLQVKYYNGGVGSDGYSTIVDGVATIFVRKDCARRRQRFTAAHELGHILLGHVGKYNLVNREPSPDDNPIEHEANVFASRLLAPACVLWALDAWTAEAIMVLCDISYQAASFRAERMEVLRQRNKFLSSPLERKVYQQFSEFIDRLRPATDQ